VEFRTASLTKRKRGAVCLSEKKRGNKILTRSPHSRRLAKRRAKPDRNEDVKKKGTLLKHHERSRSRLKLAPGKAES